MTCPMPSRNNLPHDWREERRCSSAWDAGTIAPTSQGCDVTAGPCLTRPVHSAWAPGINRKMWSARCARDGWSLPPEWQPHVALPVILGTDISGVIEALAEDVAGFAVGDEVYSMVKFPSGLAGESRAYAEYVSVPSSQIARKPARIDHIHAAGAPMALLTAWQFLIEQGHNEPNPLQPDQHLACLPNRLPRVCSQLQELPARPPFSLRAFCFLRFLPLEP